MLLLLDDRTFFIQFRHNCIIFFSVPKARALEITEAKNCVCLFLDEAADWAAELESLNEEERRSRPLFGVPLSVKECYAVKGYDHTIGLSRFLEQPGWSKGDFFAFVCGKRKSTVFFLATEDSPMVQHLKELGAVPFCLTNIPQTMKSFGCSNPIYGSTSHPMDDKV